MQIGVLYPQMELPADPATVRQYAQTVEQLGYRHIVAYDHVLGADPVVHQGWDGPYDVDTTFHEPFVLYGFLAAITSLELATGIIIAPQRQTALLAKQAAEVDILTNGRFRLGLGLGWNAVEYEALGQDFASRGRRLEEQVGLLRRLWTERVVTHDGHFDRLTGAGLAPLPVQRPIPIWLGGSSGPAYRRIGRFADGWFPQVPPGLALTEALAGVAEGAERAGRDPSAICMEGRVTFKPAAVDVFVDRVASWRHVQATHLSVSTMGSGLSTVDAHLEALATAGGALGLGAGADT
jgi:probable F420-dependent oxidoreductase